MFKAIKFFLLMIALFVVGVGAYFTFYLIVPEVWWRNVKIEKSWTCNVTYTGFKGFAYYPNHGPPQYSFSDEEIKSICPEVSIEKERATLLITRGLTLEKFRIKPLEQWRLSKSWRYGYPDFEVSSEPQRIFIYLIPEVNLGEPL